MKSVIVVIVAVIIVAGFLIFINSEAPPNPALDAFAECLTSRGAVMYGADWCSHCQNEKKAFGQSFRLVQYVECPDDPQKCLEAGIKGYPTWMFPDGRKLEGEQGLTRLASESGCSLGSSKGP